MNIVRKIVRLLTLVTAGIAALIFPLMLFAIQGFGGADFELIWTVLTLYLFHPVSIALILLASFGKLPAGRPMRIATTVVALNVLLLLATASLIQVGTFKGDTEIPVVIAVPSILFLLNSSLGARRNGRKGPSA